MILAALGINRSEVDISQIIGARPYGAPSFSVTRLETLGLRVEYHSWSLPDLLKTIDAGTPVISFVRTEFLDHWREDVAHAVVVVAAEPDRLFWIHDPALQSGPVATSGMDCWRHGLSSRTVALQST